MSNGYTKVVVFLDLKYVDYMLLIYKIKTQFFMFNRRIIYTFLIHNVLYYGLPRTVEIIPDRGCLQYSDFSPLEHKIVSGATYLAELCNTG